MDVYEEEWATNYERRANAGFPGRDGLYRICSAFMSGLPAAARILVVGCGTGAEIVPLATLLPHASFIGIDPAEPMLEVCARSLASEGLSRRVRLEAASLDRFSGESDFDAATAILVSQHLSDDGDAARFFSTIATLLKAGGRLYSADLHFASGQDRALMLSLWKQQALLSGIEPEIVDGMLAKLATDLKPRDEVAIFEFLRSAGFTRILKPYSSLIYGAWAGYRGEEP